MTKNIFTRFHDDIRENERKKKMHISRISAMNFYGARAAMVKDAAKKTDKQSEKFMGFIDECLKPNDSFINYNESSYSVPTGEFPMQHMSAKKQPFTPYDKVVPNEYIRTINAAKPEEEVVDFVSESSIIR